MAAGDRPDGRPAGRAPRRRRGRRARRHRGRGVEPERGRRPCGGGRAAAARAGLERAHPRDRPRGARTHAAGRHRRPGQRDRGVGRRPGRTGARGAAARGAGRRRARRHAVERRAAARAGHRRRPGRHRDRRVRRGSVRRARAQGGHPRAGRRRLRRRRHGLRRVPELLQPDGHAPGGGDRDRRGRWGGARLGRLRRDAVHRADERPGRRRLVRLERPDALLHRGARLGHRPGARRGPGGRGDGGVDARPGRGERRRRDRGALERTAARPGLRGAGAGRRGGLRPRRPRSRRARTGPSSARGCSAAATTAACSSP